MNNFNIKIFASLLTLIFANIAVAHNHSENNKEVDVHTTDETLLEDVNFNKMAQVAKPSTRLSMTIEGVEHEIDVMVKDDYTVLMVPVSSKDASEKILSTYKTTMNTDAVEIEYVDAE